MPALIDLHGQRFDRLVGVRRVEDRIAPSGQPSAQWLCRCDCGVEVVVLAHSLLRGRTRSCGCLNRQRSRERVAKVAAAGAAARRVERPGYAATHNRHRRTLGPASAQPCVDCGDPARDWSWIGTCDDALVQHGGQHDGLRYCLHPEHYVSRCKADHHAYDMEWRDVDATWPR